MRPAVCSLRTLSVHSMPNDASTCILNVFLPHHHRHHPSSFSPSNRNYFSFQMCSLLRWNYFYLSPTHLADPDHFTLLHSFKIGDIFQHSFLLYRRPLLVHGECGRRSAKSVCRACSTMFGRQNENSCRTRLGAMLILHTEHIYIINFLFHELIGTSMHSSPKVVGSPGLASSSSPSRHLRHALCFEAIWNIHSRGRSEAAEIILSYWINLLMEFKEWRWSWEFHLVPQEHESGLWMNELVEIYFIISRNVFN